MNAASVPVANLSTQDAVHDIEKRKIVCVTKIEVEAGWRDLPVQVRAPLQGQAVPFFGTMWSFADMQSKTGPPTNTIEGEMLK